jgi:hypothetical protein
MLAVDEHKIQAEMRHGIGRPWGELASISVPYTLRQTWKIRPS